MSAPNIVVIDVDARSGGKVEHLAALCGGTIPKTYRVQTGSGPGNEQFYFQAPPGAEFKGVAGFKDTRGVQHPGIDIRGYGGLCIAEGSPGKAAEGPAYLLLDDSPLAPLPPALMELLPRRGSGWSRSAAAAGDDGDDAEDAYDTDPDHKSFCSPDAIPYGCQGDTLYRVSAQLREVFGFTANEITAGVWAVSARCTPAFDDDDWRNQSGGRIVESFPDHSGTLPDVIDTERADVLAELGKKLRGYGYNKDEIKAILTGVNIGRCKPALSDAELAECVTGAMRGRPLKRKAAKDDATHFHRLNAIVKKNVTFVCDRHKIVYAVFDKDGVRQVVGIESEDFAGYLIDAFNEIYRNVPSGDAVKAVIDLSRVRGRKQPVSEIFLRFGMLGNKAYLDLANAAGEIVEIDADGWRVIKSKDCAVLFRRSDIAFSASSGVWRGSQ